MQNITTHRVEFSESFAEQHPEPQDGIGLCLSGGGFRAMLFHTGVLWRLNDLGLLQRLDRVSSVSGGSITAAQVGLQWKRLTWENGRARNFAQLVVEPIRRLADRTIDVKSIIVGALTPWRTISEQIIAAYKKHLYDNATLQDLPEDGAGPRFVINATNVQSGALVRFSRPYLADYRVGRYDNPVVSLATSVAASSAFPPVLSPAQLSLPRGAMQPTKGADLNREPYTTNLVLTDGGVYDNLGLETVWKRYKTVIVSDGGGQMAAEANPKSDWAQHGFRVNALIDNQVRALRKKLIVGSLVSGERKGVYWRMRGDISKYEAPNTLLCPHDRTLTLAEIPTRLAKLEPRQQERIINWGYALCDAGMRAWVQKDLPCPYGFPYPDSRV